MTMRSRRLGVSRSSPTESQQILAVPRDHFGIAVAAGDPVIDVKGYFDSIDWERLLKAVRHHTDCPWVLLYIERWLKAPVQMEDGSVVPRTAGAPQGGVITP